MGSLWYEGQIAEAVSKSKKLKAIFIVFIEGKDELSSHFNQLFQDEGILNKLKNDKFVAIKVEEKSKTHEYFSEIYPHDSIPSIFFIGEDGKAVEIVSKNVNTEELSTIIDTIIAKNEKSSTAGFSKALIDQEQKLEVSSANVSPPSTGNIEVEESNLEPSSSKQLTPEEKVQHAKILIEQRKEEKKKQEEETERQKEIERRKMGQNVQQMKRWQQEEKMKQLMEERHKEQKENQAARDRVLAQIAQDKVERAARFSKQGSTSITPTPHPSTETNKSLRTGNTTRLQFRLPEGSVYTHEFQISDTLQRVHQYIMNEITLPFTNYTISTTFPRREFGVNDNSQTLLDLQLVPNAVILILPQLQGTVSNNTSGMLGSVMWWVLAPLMGIYDFLIGFLFGAPSIRKTEPSTSTKRSASEAEVPSRTQAKRQASNTTEIKKQGNIHRLKERPDTDDENNTWNGNSTQQM